jgi:flavin-dependent dehydrogenase
METRDRLPTRPRAVVVGAGFAGLSAARELGKSGLDLLLVDRNNYHGFWPLLYQVATAGLEPEAIAYPVRAIFQNYPNVDLPTTTSATTLWPEELPFEVPERPDSLEHARRPHHEE